MIFSQLNYVLQTTTAYDFGYQSVLTDKVSQYVIDIADCDDYKMYASVKDVVLELKSGGQNETIATSTIATNPFFIGCGSNKYSYSSSMNSGFIFTNITWNYNQSIGDDDWEMEEMNGISNTTLVQNFRTYFYQNYTLMEDPTGNTLSMGFLLNETTEEDEDPKVSHQTINLGTSTNGFQLIDLNSNIYCAIVSIDGNNIQIRSIKQNNYTIQLNQTGYIPTAHSNFQSIFIPVVSNNIINVYKLNSIQDDQVDYELYGTFDLKNVYQMFNITDSFLQVNETLTLDRCQLYKQDTIIITSKLSEFEETSDTLIATFRLIDNQLDYFWTTAPPPYEIRSNTLDVVYFMSNYQIYKLTFDGLIQAVDPSINDTTKTNSCWLQSQYVDISDPTVSGVSNISLKNNLQEGVCDTSPIQLYYKDQFQTKGYTYYDDNRKASAELILAPQVKSYEITSPSLPFIDQNNNYVGNYVFLQSQENSYQTCYEVESNFEVEIVDNIVTYKPTDTSNTNGCYIDFPKIKATIQYDGYNYTDELLPDKNPSLTELNSYSKLFDPSFYPGFSESYSASNLLVGQKQNVYVAETELISCFSKQEHLYGYYYDSAYHLQTINSSESKFSQPCSFDTDIDVIEVNTEIDGIEYQLSTNEFQQHKINLYSPYLNPQIEIEPNDIPNDLAYYIKIDQNKETIGQQNQLHLWVDDGDPKTQYNFTFQTYYGLSHCLSRPDTFKIYRIDEYIYLDLQGNQNCNSSTLPNINDITLYIDDDDCSFKSVINDTIYRSSCNYQETGILEYEFSLEIYWKHYEIEEDYVLNYNVNIVDKNEKNTYHIAIIIVLIVVVVVLYALAIIVYLKKENILQWKIFDNKMYYSLQDNKQQQQDISFSLENNSDELIQQSDSLFQQDNDDSISDQSNEFQQVVQIQQQQPNKNQEKLNKNEQKLRQKQEQQRQLYQEGLFTLPQ